MTDRAAMTDATPESKIQEMQSQRESVMTNDEPAVVSDRSPSPLDEAIADPAFRLAWENDVRFHISRHLLRLRMFRKMSQVRLAKKVGTSQSAIARLESGEENVTETTVERIINALDGRLRVSIAPAEYLAAPPHLWWKAAHGQTIQALMPSAKRRTSCDG